MTDFSVLRQRMVDNQIRTSEVTDRDVIAAFLSVPREAFVPPDERPFAYADRELRMAAGRLSAPHARPRPAGATCACPAARRRISRRWWLDAAAAIRRRFFRGLWVRRGGRGGQGSCRLGAREPCGGRRSPMSRWSKQSSPKVIPTGGPYGAILIDGAVETVPEALLSQLAPGGALAAIERDGGVSRAMLLRASRQGHDEMAAVRRLGHLASGV